MGADSRHTPTMRRLHAASGEVLQQELAEIIAEKGVFAVPQGELRRIFADTLKANPNRITHFMNELGWIPDRVKWGGVDYARALWVHPDYRVSNGRVLGPNGYDQSVEPGEDEVEII